MRAPRCGHCGGMDLEWTSDTEVTCRHEKTRYRKVSKAAPSVVVRKGATVTFGPKAEVKTRGGLEIREGANVRAEGEIEIVELGAADARSPGK